MDLTEQIIVFILMFASFVVGWLVGTSKENKRGPKGET